MAAKISILAASEKLGFRATLDAATMPRAMTALEAWQDEGATCVSIDRPGSLVLLPPE